jgi:hypothetical protein
LERCQRHTRSDGRALLIDSFDGVHTRRAQDDLAERRRPAGERRLGADGQHTRRRTHDRRDVALSPRYGERCRVPAVVVRGVFAHGCEKVWIARQPAEIG